MSVLIFHPSVAPHVQQAARAIHERGQLARFITAVRDEPGRWRQRLLVSAGRLAGLQMEREFARRSVTGLPDDLIESHPWGELLRVAVARVDSDQRLSDFVWERTEYGFDRRVARKVHSDLTGVYGFESSTLATFQRARALGIPVAYEVPAPEPQFMQDVFDAEAEKIPELRTSYHRYTARREDERIARRRQEWQAATVILVASKFTRESYARAGLDVSRVRVVALGAPPPIEIDRLQRRAAADRPTFLWAGGFNARKGAHYLLEAWRAGKFGRFARLIVHGAIALPDRIIQPLPEGIELRGSIPRPELMEQYQQCDALIFPTLCDGFGMVATEAWSSGLPVITTNCAGAADLLKPGENGLLIKAGSADAIAGALQWCLDHRAVLAAMREGALTTAARWQWDDYRRALADNLQEAGLFSLR